MRLKELSVCVSRTFNLGNFDSLRLEAGATCSVEEGDDPGEVHNALLAHAKDGLARAYRDNHPSNKKGS